MVSPVTLAALYGKGIFTTIAINKSEPFLWEKHWRRLADNTEKLGIDLSEHSEETTRSAVVEIITRNAVINGRARLTFLDQSSGNIWPTNRIGKTSLLVITGDVPAVSESVRLTISPYSVNSRSPLAGVKSCNYLEKILALDEAKTRSFDEAIQVNERGHIVSAVMANVFWLRDELLCTPSLKTGCLPGTTREFLMESLVCREVEADLDELNSADAIFLTSAGLGVVRVGEFELRRFKNIDHPILKLLPK